MRLRDKFNSMLIAELAVLQSRSAVDVQHLFEWTDSQVGVFIVLCDFDENHSLIFQNEAQGFHRNMAMQLWIFSNKNTIL